MTLKDEFLIICFLCMLLITFAVRHFLGGAMYLVQHLAASTLCCMPALLHLLAGHLR